ncbi:hypothetical protein Saro_1329 [Novosphingobium aromaticivorans DSM 12444]|uniref:Periplasmic protein-like protein n=1 Tax=Novosphingobium aromaticivorans (strain ATCC 700278 / DSM 12444 / CCUG 56034 / CIP 105152 / NBRC 16084 / F199) TaxID=279238 RepID=Q2G8Q0_NOVAD|nr:hypothetical protein [Novosphingobium aromaticivorans]ABD25773.1 hypothetical protein Saro_1329 [Novosphingobium aromaticivorans DSM 12444]SCY03353.1 hypothetical protein SAMN05660666_00672 [Novosphingobium aromaticivorans]
MRAILPILALLLATGATKPVPMDPRNPSCPEKVDWGVAKAMALSVADKGGRHVLIADGIIDARLPARLKAALDADERIEEIWLKSRGGDAEAGNRAGKVIRSYPGMVTRIPAGWTCFSACNFVFMGGDRRFVDPGGIFMVHMFTHTGDRDVIEISVDEGTEETTRLIGEIEQSSALLASEDNDFLIRMGISRKLLTEIMYRQQAVATKENPSTRYCLNQEEVRKYNVVPLEKAE